MSVVGKRINCTPFVAQYYVKGKLLKVKEFEVNITLHLILRSVYITKIVYYISYYFLCTSQNTIQYIWLLNCNWSIIFIILYICNKTKVYSIEFVLIYNQVEQLLVYSLQLFIKNVIIIIYSILNFHFLFIWNGLFVHVLGVIAVCV